MNPASGFAIIIFLAAAYTLADIPTATQTSEVPRRIATIIEHKLESESSFVDALISTMGRSYDLTSKADQANKSTSEADYRDWLKSKGVTQVPDKRRALSLLAEYWRAQHEVDPEVISWMLIWLSFPEGSWQAFHADLQAVNRARPNDLLPKLAMLPRRVANQKEFEEWIDTLKRAYSLSTNEEQKAACLLLALTNPCLLETTNSANANLSTLADWASSLEQSSQWLAVKIRVVQLFVAINRADYAEAARHATRGTLYRSVVPLWLMSKGKFDLASQVIHELRSAADLDDSEKKTIEWLDGVLPKQENAPK